jgi:hypothetical protein
MGRDRGKSEQTTKTGHAGKLSLQPLSYEEAVSALLKVKPEPKKKSNQTPKK